MNINGLNGFHHAIGNTPPRYRQQINMVRFPECPLLASRVHTRPVGTIASVPNYTQKETLEEHARSRAHGGA